MSHPIHAALEVKQQQLERLRQQLLQLILSSESKRQVTRQAAAFAFCRNR